MARREALWQAMQDADVTGKEIAAALGLTEGRYSQLLNGRPIKEDQIKIICEVLAICADVIIFDRPHTPADEYEAEFIKLYRTKLNQTQRIRFVQFMREFADQI